MEKLWKRVMIRGGKRKIGVYGLTGRSGSNCFRSDLISRSANPWRLDEEVNPRFGVLTLVVGPLEFFPKSVEA